MAQYITHSPEETIQLGRLLATCVRGGDVIAFKGGLGAGKTTFCRGLAAGFDCVDQASSPTYSVVNLYRGPLMLAHFDLYRVQSEEDLEAAGFYDYLNQGAVVAVEWSERLPVEATVQVGITADETGSRIITIEGVCGL